MRTLSGIQPSGKMHFGNYLGYARFNKEWHKKATQGYIVIVDLHALTTVSDPKLLRTYTNELLLDLLACDFDLEKTIIFKQSDIKEHTELLWYLLPHTPMGLLERAVGYKDKVERGIAASAGLFTYPVLQAADIVLYDIDKVPVGKDQMQHLEMCRDIAIKFNNVYGPVLTIPEGVVQPETAVVPGIDGQKMSKSYGNTIPFLGTDEEIKKAIMSIQTDSRGQFDPKDPDTCIIYKLHAYLLDANSAVNLADEYKNGLSYGDAKKKFLADYIDFISPMRLKRAQFSTSNSSLQELLQVHTAKAQAQATMRMEAIRTAIGL